LQTGLDFRLNILGSPDLFPQFFLIKPHPFVDPALRVHFQLLNRDIKSITVLIQERLTKISPHLILEHAWFTVVVRQQFFMKGVVLFT
jgi:hypothetical protein